MAKGINKIIDQIGHSLINQSIASTSHNRYTLTIDELNSPISILNVTGEEQLNHPWRYTITFTSVDKTLSVDSFLNKKASFSFNPVMSEALSLNAALRALGDFIDDDNGRKIYGIITEFSQISVNKDEAHYQVVLSPRVARLRLNRNCAIFQNQNVVSVVEEVLRSHEFTGIDYRLELKEQYPTREFITQWQESDLEFIQRLMADVGIWFRFESHAEHDCEVMVISDYEQGFEHVAEIDYKLPSGTHDGKTESVWDLSMQSQMVESSVQVQDYNYRKARTDLLTSENSQPDDHTTYGTNYRYGENHKNLNSTNSSNQDNNITAESGSWYARIRHEYAISKQIVITGKTNRYNLEPGQVIRITDNQLTNIDEGIIVLSVTGKGNRTDAYELSFTAIPFNVLKPYRPVPIVYPKIGGTLPARVTSPDNDIYGYIDTQGRYRVKFNFDLKNWKKGNESLWVRLAKPYAGDTYGFHFPLIDGTEVAIAFTDSNPDRPYIAHAMHDSAHPDHVSAFNKHRNVIRTPANNKLRMDDKRDQEHIKLATEYGKTQLNIGHLVNKNKEKRGEGLELRTDDWGAIRAGKGLYITSEEQTQAGGLQLQMDNAVKELAQACEMVKRLNELAQAAKTELADLQVQKQLFEQSLKQLKQPGILTYAPAGMADVTPNSIQHTAGENIIQTAQNNIDVSAFKRFIVTAGNTISLFANKLGIKITASKGNVDLQAQNNKMLLSSKQDMKITSTDSEVIISAKKKLTLECNGAAIIIEGGGVKILAPGDVKVEAASFGVFSPSTYDVPKVKLPEGKNCSESA